MRLWALGLIWLAIGACSTTPVVHVQAPQRCPGLGCLAAEPEASGPPHGRAIAFGGNVLVGGITAGVGRRRDGGSFRSGFVRGAAGGAGVFAGKWIAAESFRGAGALGRGVAAGGASITRNAADGRSSLERLVLPVGPLRFRWQPGEGASGVSLDAVATAALLRAAFSDGSFDLSRSLSFGVPVFLVRDWTPSHGWHGRHLGGAVLVRGDPWAWSEGRDFLDRVAAHERAHVLQYDQAYILWGASLDDRLLGALGVPERLARRVDLSVHALIFAALQALAPGVDAPFEYEADALARTYGSP